MFHFLGYVQGSSLVLDGAVLRPLVVRVDQVGPGPPLLPEQHHTHPREWHRRQTALCAPRGEWPDAGPFCTLRLTALHHLHHFRLLRVGGGGGIRHVSLVAGLVFRDRRLLKNLPLPPASLKNTHLSVFRALAHAEPNIAKDTSPLSPSVHAAEPPPPRPLVRASAAAQ